MKFALATLGSRGDVEPFTAVGRELVRRGHEVHIAVPPNLVAFVRSAGLAAVEYGPSSRELQTADHVRNFLSGAPHPLNVVCEVIYRINRFWPHLSETLTSLTDGADLLLTDASAQGLAANVAERYEVPRATLNFFPSPVGEPGGVVGQAIREAEDAQRRVLGLPQAVGSAAHGALEIQAYDQMCFPGLADEWARCGVTRPFIGALTLGLPTAADGDVLAWIAEDSPPIYFGFGSNVRIGFAAQTVALISAACAQVGLRALVCSGTNDFTSVPQFDNVKVVPAVNHSVVFPACRALVHHGGAGTTAAGLRAGIPALILWLWVDQPIWGEVVERLKVGTARRFSDISQQLLVTDLRRVLSPHYATAAREVAAQMIQPAESVANAADLLEDAAGLGRYG
ncbi:glycosyltransferase [Mycobacterium sp. 4858]|uniref:glycosyltransferase n=1 Tax=Mycobacterium sp. 4858 TaxID=2057185 RepID=UPI000C83F35F|nr:glycosyltransferase [Mycobacterium sp. 4858]